MSSQGLGDMSQLQMLATLHRSCFLTNHLGAWSPASTPPCTVDVCDEARPSLLPPLLHSSVGKALLVS